MFFVASKTTSFAGLRLATLSLVLDVATVASPFAAGGLAKLGRSHKLLAQGARALHRIRWNKCITAAKPNARTLVDRGAQKRYLEGAVS